MYLKVWKRLCGVIVFTMLSTICLSQNISIGNLVWLDIDEDGSQDNFETGVSDVIIDLYEITDSAFFVAREITDENGNYLFDSLIRGRTYELRIDLSQTLFSKWDIKPTTKFNSTIQSDSNGDDSYYPGYDVIRFSAASTSVTFDFGLIDVRFKDRRINLCENAFGAGATSFDLRRLESNITGGSFRYDVQFYQTQFDLNNGVNEINSDLYSSQDGSIYALVTCSTDERKQLSSTVEITLNYIDSMDYTEESLVVCPNTELDLSRQLRYYNAEYRGLLDTLRVFTSPDYDDASEIDASAYTPSSLPDTLYFYATDARHLCYTDGALYLTEKPIHEVMIASHERICPTDSISLRRLEGMYERNGLCISTAWWSSLSNGGRYNMDSTALLGDYYIPSEVEVQQEYAELVFHVVDQDCGREVTDTVLVEIYPFGLFIECRNDTVNCRAAVADAVTTANYNRPLALYDCDSLDVLLLGEQDRYFGCDSHYVKYFYREWLLSNKDESILCRDTIFVESIVHDSIQWPDSTVEFDCERSFGRIGGTNIPSPAAAGIPKAGGVNLYPSEDICGWQAEFYDEEFDPNCGERVNVVKRTWRVFNNCTGIHYEFEQWLRIKSNLGPVPIIESLPSLDRNRNTFTLLMDTEHECELRLDPIFRANPICSGVKEISYRVEETAEKGGLIRIPDRANRWKFQRPPHLPYREDGYVIRFYTTDSCWNMDSTIYQFRMEDHNGPMLEVDAFRKVTVSEDVEFLPINALTEEIIDPCGLAHSLVRREDWIQKLEISCPEFIQEVVSTQQLLQKEIKYILRDIIPPSTWGNIYRKYIRQLADDPRASAQLIYQAFKYDLHRYWINQCLLDEHANPRLSLDTLELYYDTLSFGIDQLKQLGGGWMPELPLCCSDACDTLTVQYAAIDQFGNIGRTWNNLLVKSEAKYQIKEELDDIVMSCQALSRHDLLNLIDSLDYVQLDSILGDYSLSNEKSTFEFTDYLCSRKDSTYEESYIDHDNIERWRTINKEIFALEPDVRSYSLGCLSSSCSSASIQQRYWVEIDECGEGLITREFYLHNACGKDPLQLLAKQFIRIVNYADCQLDQDMFEFPRDAFIVGELEYRDDGTVNTPSQVTFVRPLFFERCNPFGVHYEDLVFPTTSPDQFRIERTWTIRDWCSDSILTHEQRLIYTDLDLGHSQMQPSLISNSNGETGESHSSVQLTIAPNPSYGEVALFLRTDGDKHLKLTITDHLGRIVIGKLIHANSGEQTIHLSQQEFRGTHGLLLGQLTDLTGPTSTANFKLMILR